MATSKKTTSDKAEGKPAQGKATGGESKKRAAAPPKAQNSLWARISTGLLCLCLALFVILILSGAEAVFLTLLGTALRGVMGYGLWLAAPALLMAAYVFLFRRKDRITLRVFCILMLPLLVSAMLHVLFVRMDYGLDLAALQLLWADGQTMRCGGTVSGLIAEGLVRLFSRVGAFFLLLLIFAVFLLVAFHVTPEKLGRGVQSSWKNGKARRRARQEAYDSDEEEEDFSPRQERIHDLPLDERTGEVPRKAKRGLFNRSPGVRRPDEVIQTLHSDKTEALPVKELPVKEPPAKESPVPAEERREEGPVESHNPPFVAPDPEPVLELLDEPLLDLSKNEKKQAIREHLETVARDAANSLEQTPTQYRYPASSLLTEVKDTTGGAVQDELAAVKKRLSETIASFGIEAGIAGAVRGPSVTRYEAELEQGVRLNRLTNLSDDIALALGASGVRIAPVPGKISLVGIEVPNKVISEVRIREVIESQDFQQHKSKVAFAVGKDIGGNYIIGDAARLPHLLIAGTTGSGKSVCMNSLIISLLYKAAPEDVRLIMVDPKMVELGIYNGIPHLLIPVVTDPKKAAGALQWAVTEMMKRYRLFSDAGVRELASYNAWAKRQKDVPKLPQIVIVIDELADLMLVAAKEVEESICRVAQMGRAAGMHLIIATQRPSADVITGLMKANIPSRIAFAVASSMESRIILDTQGAEKLVGKGDMLWFPLGAGKPLRVQGCLIDDREVSIVAEQVKANSTATYDEEVLQEIELNAQEHGGKGSKGQNGAASAPAGEEEGYDELLPAAVDVILEIGQASASMLQRRLKLGYARASRLIDQMEDRGIVGPHGGSKPRQILITKEKWDAMQGRPLGDTAREGVKLYEGEGPENVQSGSEAEELPPWVE